MSHEITLESIPTMSVGELSALPASDLMGLSKKADDVLKHAKLIKGWIDGALRLRYEDKATSLRKLNGRETGIVHFMDENIKVTASLPKKISWDQDKLSVLAEQIKDDGDEIEDYLDLTYHIPERRYSAWPEKFRQRFAQARTFSHGKQTFTLQPQEEKIL